MVVLAPEQCLALELKAVGREPLGEDWARWATLAHLLLQEHPQEPLVILVGEQGDYQLEQTREMTVNMKKVVQEQTVSTLLFP